MADIFVIDTRLQSIQIVAKDKYNDEWHVRLEEVPEDVATNLQKLRVVPDEEATDQDIYCLMCEKFKHPFCKEHPFYHIGDRVRSDTRPDEPRSYYTCPLFFKIRPSPLHGLGIFASYDLPAGLFFGPYEGLKTTKEKADRSGYAWEIATEEGTMYIDASDPKKSNWLRYINCAPNETLQNMKAITYCGRIYYYIFRPVKTKEELLLAKMGGVESKVDVEAVRKEVNSHPVVMFSKSHCGYCVKAKDLLANEKIEFKERDLDAMKAESPKEHQSFVNGLVYTTRITGVPQIFICGKLIGGYTELAALAEGKTLLDKVSECAKEHD
ncbi:unnamed protein product, partial [Mesorhabditis spiculigera]